MLGKETNWLTVSCRVLAAGVRDATQKAGPFDGWNGPLSGRLRLGVCVGRCNDPADDDREIDAQSVLKAVDGLELFLRRNAYVPRVGDDDDAFGVWKTGWRYRLGRWW